MRIEAVGFVGFGEAASALAQGLSAQGVQPLSAFDREIAHPRMGEIIKNRLRAAGVLPMPDLASLVDRCDLILSLVPPDTALSVASQAASLMRAGKTYVDMNSVSSGTKKAMARLFAGTEGNFIEAAILTPVAALGAKSPIVVCGEGAEQFAQSMTDCGLQVTWLGREVGRASALKMLRSVFSKGVEALLLEMLVGAYRCGIVEPLMEDLTSYMDSHSFREIANTWVTTNAVHAGRRVSEMDEVIDTLRELSVEPIMALATRERLERSSETAALDHFHGRAPADYHDVIAYLEAKE